MLCQPLHFGGLEERRGTSPQLFPQFPTHLQAVLPVFGLHCVHLAKCGVTMQSGSPVSRYMSEDSMLVKMAQKSHTPTREVSFDEQVAITSNTPSTSGGAFISTPCSVSISRAVDMKREMFDLQEVDALIQRYLTNGQFKSALFWADKRLALCRTGGKEPSCFDMVEFIRVLATIGDWTRLIAYIDRHELAMKHLFFAYHYINALYNKKLYMEILKLKLDSLKGFTDPLTVTASYMSHLTKLKSFLPNIEEVAFLDKLSDELKLEAGLCLLLGKTYLISQNRRAAQRYLHAATLKDPFAAEALDLIQKHKLRTKRSYDDFNERAESCSDLIQILFYQYFSPDLYKPSQADEGVKFALGSDLSIQTAQSAHLYQIGDISGANRITSSVMDEAGMFEDCLLIHIATLVQMKKAEELFTLAHQLVDTRPDDHLSWYAVGCYYYSIGHLNAAKNFLNKCTTMNCAFGEGWLAFGHVLTAESEHEQAMNCYLRAARVLEGCFEPLMYIGLEYSYASNTKLAQDFLKDAAEIAKDNPLILHEQGCICFMKKEYQNAETHFTKALKLAYSETDFEIDVIDLLLKPLSEFWEPLVSNLGHTKRRAGKYREAVRFHQKALLMCPHKASSVGAIAFTLATAGELQQSVPYFHEALSLSPHDTVLKDGLERVMLTMDSVKPRANVNSDSQFLLLGNTLPLTKEDLEFDEDEVIVQRRAIAYLKAHRKHCEQMDSSQISMDKKGLLVQPTDAERQSVAEQTDDVEMS